MEQDAYQAGQADFNLPHDVITLPSQGIFYKSKKKTIKVGYLTASDENIIASADSKKSIQEITIAAGGVAATPLRLKQTEDFLKTNLDIEAAVKILNSEFQPLSDVRATSAYRHVLIENFFRRFFAECGVVK